MKNGLYLITDGRVDAVTPTMVAQWLSLGRGGPLRLDLEYGAHLVAGVKRQLRGLRLEPEEDADAPR